jgi:hypothetical protein
MLKEVLPLDKGISFSVERPNFLNAHSPLRQRAPVTHRDQGECR